MLPAWVRLVTRLFLVNLPSNPIVVRILWIGQREQGRVGLGQVAIDQA